MIQVEGSALPASQTELNAPIPRRTQNVTIPLTDNQQAYWSGVIGKERRLVQRMQAAAVRILGPLDCGALAASIEAVGQRHESLRTVIVPDGETATQHVLGASSVLARIDLTKFSPDSARREATVIARQFFERGMDVCTEPLFSPCLLKLSDDEYVFLAGLEHMAGDGASCGILTREIWTAYNQISQGLPLSLPKLLAQFPDYALWQHRHTAPRRQKDEPYWSARMQGATYMKIPHGSSDSHSAPQVTQLRNVPLGKAATDGLRDVARQERTLLPIVCLSVYVMAMSRWCEQRDLSLLFASNGRFRRPELQNMIGFLARSLPFRVEIGSNDNFSDVVKRVHAEFTAATEHQDFVLAPPSDLTHAHLFNWGGMVTYSARWSVDQQRKAVSGIRIQPFRVGLQSSYRFYPSFCDTPSGIVATIHHQEDFIGAATIDRLGRNMRSIADALRHEPLSRVGALRLES